MTDVQAAAVKVVPPGGGRSGDLAPGIGVIFKIDGQDSGGALSIVEHPFAVGALVPPHIHRREDEFSIVLEGEIGFRSDDNEVVLGPGGYIVKPRGEVHTMWNAGTMPARMIEVISPAGFENFFRELADMTASGSFKMPAVAELAGRYELPFAEPEWLPDVIARYNLTPPSLIRRSPTRARVALRSSGPQWRGLSLDPGGDRVVFIDYQNAYEGAPRQYGKDASSASVAER